MDKIPNILVTCPGWVGDTVMATPAIRALRKGFPEARLTALIRPPLHRIIEGSPDLDRIIPSRPRGIRELWHLSRALGADRYDLALILPNSFRSAVPPFLARIPRRVGYRTEGRGWLLTDRVRPEREGWARKPVPMVDYYRRLCEAAGCPWAGDELFLPVPEALASEADRRLRGLGVRPGERLIGLNPGASFGSSKLWPAERFARAADLLHERFRSRVIIFVGPGEREIGDRIEAMMTAPVINTGAEPLGLDVLKPCVRGLRLLVTNDTGPRHYAVAFGVPSVVIMGSTDPRYTAKSTAGSIVLRRDVDCGPCHKKVCPEDHRCMTRITPEDVLEAAEELDRRHGIG